MIPSAVSRYCQEAGLGEITSIRSVGGGCINNGSRLVTTSGVTLFLKTNPVAPADMFAREAEGLLALMADGAPRVPQALLFGEGFLLLEDLAPAVRREDYWALFGQQMAALHAHTNPHFGFHHDNYIGSTPQPNPWTVDGYAFYCEYRLRHQARLASEKGLLTSQDENRLERLCTRLREMLPVQPASLLHGDLWSGNATSDSAGNPAVIDPAAYFGWAEADLAMTTLFGSFPEPFFRAYLERRPLETGYRDRFPIYNLYHLLNHLNLFGSGYLGAVKETIIKFS